MLGQSNAPRSLLHIVVIMLIAGYVRGADNEWPGTLERPSKGVKKIVFIVDSSQDEPLAKGLKYRGEYFDFSEVVWGQGSLTFLWRPGPKDVHCKLIQGGEVFFSGGCAVTCSEDIAQMTLWMPEEEAEERGDQAGVASGNAEEGQNKVKNGAEDRAN
jgi:hypothetical protein